MTDQATTIERSKNRWKKWLGAFLSIGCIGYIGYFFVENRKTIDIAVTLDVQSVLLVAFLLTLYFFLYSYRFVLMMQEHCSQHIGVIKWFQMLIVMRLLNSIVPQAGTVYRGVRLKKDYGIPYTDYVTAYSFFIWSDTVLNFFLAGCLIEFANTKFSFSGIAAAPVLFGMTLLLAVIPFVAKSLFAVVPAKRRGLGYVAAKLGEIADGAVQGARNLRYMFLVNFIALISFVVMVVIFQFLFRSLGQEVDAPTLSIFYALYRLTLLVNITPGNIGIRELAYGYLSSQASVGMAEGIVVSALIRIWSIAVLGLLGFIFALPELRNQIPALLRNRQNMTLP